MATPGDRQSVKLKTLLNLATFLTNNNGSSMRTVCEIFRLTRRRLISLLDKMLMFGWPPYGPLDYVDVWIEGNRIWIANTDWLCRPLNLTAEEAVSLKLMIRDVIRQSPGVFEDAAASLEAKVQAFLGHPGEESTPPRPAARKIDAIKRALTESRLLEIVYYDRETENVTVRKVEPFATADWAGTQCLVAYDRYSHKPTRFSVARIREARLLDETFAPREGLLESMRERINWVSRRRASCRLTVRFGPKRARWARESFDYARTEDEQDGGVRCVFSAFDNGSLADFIAEFEGEVEVEGPEELCSRFHAYLDTIRDLYN